jgi:hypothetical protein
MTRIRSLRSIAVLTAASAAVLTAAVAATAGGTAALAGTGPAATGPAVANSGLAHSGVADSRVANSAVAISTGRTPPTTTFNSLHWAGYTFPVGHVTGVRTQWTEPKVTGKKGEQEFVWLGIGGWGANDDNIIQEGTFAWFPSNTQRNEGIWYELVPNYFARYAGVGVSPGDHISASITLVSARKHEWRVAMVDSTSGARWSKNLTFRSLETFPSFVVEDPDMGSKGASGPFFPFPHFTPVTFTHVGILIGRRWIAAAQLSRYRINMVRGSKTLATTGSLSRFSSFTVTDR